jgi:hypothetical protein
MDNTTKSTLVKTLQKEFVRRKLVQYFESKGYDNFQVNAYPPSIVDIMERIDALNGIVEINHNLEDVNIQNNDIKLAWNLFVLGNNRAFLGYTTHQSLTEVETAGHQAVQYNGPITIKQLVEWMVDTIGESSKLTEIYDNNSKAQNNSTLGMTTNKSTIPSFNKRV